jgi:tetratricopeptide repeat protein 7
MLVYFHNWISKLLGSPHSSDVVSQGDDGVNEFEIWQGLANLYSSLCYWRDAEICLQKARALKSYSSATLHAEGEKTIFIN